MDPNDDLICLYISINPYVRRGALNIPDSVLCDLRNQETLVISADFSLLEILLSSQSSVQHHLVFPKAINF
jgi:hypothetical protein